MLLPERTIYALVFYGLCMSLLTIYKPPALFRNDRIRPFGVGPDKTLLSFGSVSIGLAVSSMTLFTLVDVIGRDR